MNGTYVLDVSAGPEAWVRAQSAFSGDWQLGLWQHSSGRAPAQGSYPVVNSQRGWAPPPPLLHLLPL